MQASFCLSKLSGLQDVHERSTSLRLIPHLGKATHKKTVAPLSQSLYHMIEITVIFLTEGKGLSCLKQKNEELQRVLVAERPAHTLHGSTDDTTAVNQHRSIRIQDCGASSDTADEATAVPRSHSIRRFFVNMKFILGLSSRRTSGCVV